jgi:hypothetical protein
MSLSPLPQRPISRRTKAHAAVCGNDHDQARREDRNPKQAMSRTEPSGYSQIIGAVAHASVKPVIGMAQKGRCHSAVIAAQLVAATVRIGNRIRGD